VIWYSWHCVHYWSTLYAAGYNIIECGVIIECDGLCTAEIINTTWFNYSHWVVAMSCFCWLSEWSYCCDWLSEWSYCCDDWWFRWTNRQSSDVSGWCEDDRVQPTTTSWHWHFHTVTSRHTRPSHRHWQSTYKWCFHSSDIHVQVAYMHTDVLLFLS